MSTTATVTLPASTSATILHSSPTFKFHPSSATHNTFTLTDRYDSVMNELREATMSPTPVSALLRDPVVLTTLIGRRHTHTPIPVHSHTHKKTRRATNTAHPTHARDREASDREHGSSAQAHTRSPKRSGHSDSARVLTLLLAEEEKHARHLQAALRIADEARTAEAGRADAAEQRARAAESHARELAQRIAGAETARRQAEVSNDRAQLRAEAAERERKRTESDLRRIEGELVSAERARREADHGLREAQAVVRAYRMQEEEWEHGRKAEVRRVHEDGREDAYEDGRMKGYEVGLAEGRGTGHAEGYAAGRTEGYRAGHLIGYEEGRKVGFKEGREAERAHALQAIDKFVVEEVGRRSVVTLSTVTEEDRTQQWVTATSHLREAELASDCELTPIAVRAPSMATIPISIGSAESTFYEEMKARTPSPTPKILRASSPAPLSVKAPLPVKAPVPQEKASCTATQLPKAPSPAPVPVWIHRRLNTAPGRPSWIVPARRCAGVRYVTRWAAFILLPDRLGWDHYCILMRMAGPWLHSCSSASYTR